jgi:hypothetical protein
VRVCVLSFNFTQLFGTIKHYIYNNENDGEYLLPEFKHINFLWLMQDDMMKDEDVAVFYEINKNRTFGTVGSRINQ